MCWGQNATLQEANAPPYVFLLKLVQELFPKRLLITRGYPHWFNTLIFQDAEAVLPPGSCPNS